MAVESIRLSDLPGLSKERRDEILNRFETADSRSLNGETASLDSRIAAYEQRYNMPSARMREEVQAGRLPESSEICTWFMLLTLRERIGG